METPVSLETSSRIVWEIENINKKGEFYSKEFNLLGSRWKLQFQHHSYPAIYLSKIDRRECFRPFYATCFIETRKGLHRFNQTVEIEKPPNGCWKTIWYKGELATEEAKWLSGVVTFVLLGSPIDAAGREDKSVQTLRHMDPVPCFESLSSDFNSLLVSGVEPDVNLKCGDTIIPAHKLVLCARSAVFSAMFSCDMMESRTGSVDIVDLDPSLLNQLLQYLYSGKVTDITMDSAQSLYSSGCKYAVRALKDNCRSFLIENLNDENVCDLLVFADLHSDKVLKDAAIEHFVNNGELLKSDAWFKFSSEQAMMAVDVYRVCFEKR